MEKEFVPYQQSLDMKDIGFDEPCFGWYENGLFIFWFDSKQEPELLLNCTAPTFSQAFAWFREKHGLNGNIGDVYGDFDAWSFAIAKKGKGMIVPFRTDDINYNTYPEAELACLNKLIELAKKTA